MLESGRLDANVNRDDWHAMLMLRCYTVSYFPHAPLDIDSVFQTTFSFPTVIDASPAGYRVTTNKTKRAPPPLCFQRQTFARLPGNQRRWWMDGWMMEAGIISRWHAIIFSTGDKCDRERKKTEMRRNKRESGEKSGEKQEGAGFDVTAAKQTLCGLDRGWRRETGVLKNSESTSPRVSFILLLWIDRFVTCLHQWLWLYFFPPFIPERR